MSRTAYVYDDMAVKGRDDHWMKEARKRFCTLKPTPEQRMEAKTKGFFQMFGGSAGHYYSHRPNMNHYSYTPEGGFKGLNGPSPGLVYVDELVNMDFEELERHIAALNLPMPLFIRNVRGEWPNDPDTV